MNNITTFNNISLNSIILFNFFKLVNLILTKKLILHLNNPIKHLYYIYMLLCLNSNIINETIIYKKLNILAFFLNKKRIILNQNSIRTKAEVESSNKKHHKQKGTGHARAGNMKVPNWRGGGTVMSIKAYKKNKINKKINKKMLFFAFLLKRKTIIWYNNLNKLLFFYKKAKNNIILVNNSIIMQKIKTKFNPIYNINNLNWKNILLSKYIYINIYDINKLIIKLI